MNFAKINQQAVKTIIDGGKWGFKIPGYWDGDYLIITFDGYCAYFLPKKYVVFDKEHIQKTGKLFPDVDKIALPENEVQLTRTYVESGVSVKGLLRVFKGKNNGKDYKTYVDSNMMKPLIKEQSIISYYQVPYEDRDRSLQPIIACKSGSGIPLMALLPVRVHDQSEFD